MTTEQAVREALDGLANTPMPTTDQLLLVFIQIVKGMHENNGKSFGELAQLVADVIAELEKLATRIAALEQWTDYQAGA